MAKLDPPVDARPFIEDERQRKLQHEQRLKALFEAPEPAKLKPWRHESMASAAAPPMASPTLLPTSPSFANLVPLAVPPGRTGALVELLQRNAMFPVTSVTVAAVLGVLAGLSGRAYSTPGKPTGLNIYLVLMGRSATGKEALHEMAGHMLAALRAKVPSAAELVNFNDYASGPALAKACAEGNRCMVSFAGELGRKLKKMANAKDTPMQDLRTALTKFYSKSGPTDYVGDVVYSQSRVTVPGAVAFSLVGETTPGTALQALTLDMAEDGLVSRVHFEDVADDAPPYNEASELGLVPLTAQLQDALAALAVQATTLMHNGKQPQVEKTPEAWDELRAFQRYGFEQVQQAGANEMRRSLWSRAHLKALKYASLLAAFEAPLRPVVTLDMARWATAFAMRGVQSMQQRMNIGDIGDGDDVLAKRLTTAIHDYMREAAPKGVPPSMHKAGIVPRRWLQQRTANVAAFKHHRLGATKALDDALRSLCDSGYLYEAERHKMLEDFGAQGRCFYLGGAIGQELEGAQ